MSPFFVFDHELIHFSDKWIPLFSHPTKMALTKKALPLTTSKQAVLSMINPPTSISLPYLPKEWMLDFKFMPIKLTKNYPDES